MKSSTWRSRLGGAVAGTCLAAGITLATASPAGAVGPHQHTLTNPAGTHDIAGGFCNGHFAVGSPENVAIENFHMRIHVGDAGPDGVVTMGGGPCG